MRTPELEARVAALERIVAQLAAERTNGATPSHPWLDKVFGIFADDPEFEAAVQAGQQWRNTEEHKGEEAA